MAFLAETTLWATGVWCVVALEGLLRVSLVFRVIMRRLAVPTAAAWLLLLFFVPVASWVLYLLVGENRLGARRAAMALEITRSIEAQAVELWKHRHERWGNKEKEFAHLATLATNISALPPLDGNSLALISGTGEFLDRIMKDIDAAEHHVHMLFYIWMPESKGAEMVEAVIRAARRGVRCRVLVDAFGSEDLLKSDLAEKMRSAGVTVVAALPVNAVRALLARIDLRNHRKIVVIDGKIGYTGSQNITDDTFKTPKASPVGSRVGPWVEASVRVTGPAVHALQAIFLGDWLLDAGEPREELLGLLDLPIENAGASVVHSIPLWAGAEAGGIHQLILAALYTAREEVIMTTPYFVPDPATFAALVNASMRGVAVTLIVPRKLDTPLVDRAAKSHYLDLLEAGVRIYEHQRGLLHSKTITIDRRIAVLTTANLDQRSFYLNFENTLLCYDDEFSSEMRFLQSAYLGESREIHLDEWRRRRIWARFVDNITQLLGPLL